MFYVLLATVFIAVVFFLVVQVLDGNDDDAYVKRIHRERTGRSWPN
jgi:hypothetical protein